MRRLALVLALALAPAAQAAERPVVDLDEHPGLCVRMDRPVTYVGTPSADQDCPARVIGRARARFAGGGPEPTAAPAAATVPRSALQLRTGLGFDACTAPSSQAMAAWRRASPYRTIGVYVGGRNRGCTQANLTAPWVAQQAAAGWSFIPTYVGLQAPGSSCADRCVLMSPGRAAAQGAAEAEDAVAQMAALGFGAGSPVYFDLEHYARTAATTRTVLTFLDAWTERLHARGYLSGVYSSASSGITELVEADPLFWTLPDDLWIANWDRRATTADPYVPADRWRGRRLRQYRGDHLETWGGVTINIDNNAIGGHVAVPGASADSPYGTPAPKRCRVPKLVGKRLPKVRQVLAAKRCRLGYVRGPRRGRVVRQQFEPQSTRRAGARIGVKLRARP